MKHKFNEDTAPTLLTLRLSGDPTALDKLHAHIATESVVYLGEQVDADTGEAIPGSAVVRIDDPDLSFPFFEGLPFATVDTSIANRGRKTQPVTVNGKLITSETVIPDDFRPGGTD